MVKPYARACRPITLICALILTLFVLGSSVVEGGKPKPRYVSAEMRWEELKEKYGEYGVVQLTDDVVVEVSLGSTGKLSTKVLNTRTYAIFDPNRAEDVLNQVFTISPGAKVKSVHGWSHELRSKEVKWTEGTDVHKKKTLGGFQEVRVALPSIGDGGVCGIATEQKLGGWVFIDHDFMSSVPLIKGEFQFIRRGRLMGVGIGRYWSVGWVGDIEEIPTKVTSDGRVMSWKARDLQPRFESPLASAFYQDRSELFFAPNSITWADWVQYFDAVYKDIKPPREILKAAKDTLKSTGALEKVQAIARFIDDPSNFKLLGPARSGFYGSSDLEQVVSSREGTAFSKALLAHTLLRDLGVKNYLTMAFSLLETMPDWRFISPYEFLDAAMVWVPEINNDFIWDVANKSVPLGTAGADLYWEMLVIDPSLELHPFETFSIKGGVQKESRRIDWTMDEGGSLVGTFSCRIEGWPMNTDLDPWDSSQNLGETITSEIPSEVSLSGLTWNASVQPGVRLSDENPARITGEVEAEAVPYGDSQWEIKPFFWPLPSVFDDLANPLQPFPVLLANQVVLSDSVYIKLDGRAVKQRPQEVRLVNSSGAFFCKTETKADGILMTRLLSLASQHIVKEDLPNLTELCKAWISSKETSVVIE